MKKNVYLLPFILIVLFLILIITNFYFREDFIGPLAPPTCPVTDWSPCSRSCGTGTQTRTIINNPTNANCPVPLLIQSCNNVPCTPQANNFYNTVLEIFKYNPILGNVE